MPAGPASCNPAIDAGFVLRAGHNQPVVDRAFPLTDVPAKDFFIEICDSLRFFSRDLKMDDAVHGIPRKECGVRGYIKR
jgi:hypothetical protein